MEGQFSELTGGAGKVSECGLLEAGTVMSGSSATIMYWHSIPFKLQRLHGLTGGFSDVSHYVGQRSGRSLDHGEEAHLYFALPTRRTCHLRPSTPGDKQRLEVGGMGRWLHKEEEEFQPDTAGDQLYS